MGREAESKEQTVSAYKKAFRNGDNDHMVKKLKMGKEEKIDLTKCGCMQLL